MKQSKFYQIKNITEYEYTLVGCDGSIITRPIQDVDKSASAFTIQDAKDGDVLAESKEDVILIFRGIGNTRWDDAIDYYCYYDCYQKDFIVQEDVNHWGDIKNNQLKPATKEQRDLLFQKMHEAGYEWDAENKELKKIDARKNLTLDGDLMQADCMIVEQKPADKVEPKCEESKTKIFDAPTPFEDKLYAFVLACEILVDPSKREFILEHSQEILDAAREQIGKEQNS